MVNDPFRISAEPAARSASRRRGGGVTQPSFRQEPDWLIIFASALFLLSLLIAWLVIGVD